MIIVRSSLALGLVAGSGGLGRPSRAAGAPAAGRSAGRPRRAGGSSGGLWRTCVGSSSGTLGASGRGSPLRSPPPPLPPFRFTRTVYRRRLEGRTGPMGAAAIDSAYACGRDAPPLVRHDCARHARGDRHGAGGRRVGVRTRVSLCVAVRAGGPWRHGRASAWRGRRRGPLRPGRDRLLRRARAMCRRSCRDVGRRTHPVSVHAAGEDRGVHVRLEHRGAVQVVVREGGSRRGGHGRRRDRAALCDGRARHASAPANRGVVDPDLRGGERFVRRRDRSVVRRAGAARTARRGVRERVCGRDRSRAW